MNWWRVALIHGRGHRIIWHRFGWRRWNDAPATDLATKDKILEIHLHQYQDLSNDKNLSQQNNRTKTNGKRQHSAKSDVQKQKSGLNAEQRVYDKLCCDFPGTVEWVSSNAVKAEVLAPGQADDRLGYDMRYTDESGNLRYAEVKNAGDLKTDTCSFIITQNEEKFAKEHTHQYSIFLVVDDSHIEQITGDNLMKYLVNAVPESKKCVIPLINKSVDI